jgi:hypothetical protein
MKKTTIMFSHEFIIRGTTDYTESIETAKCQFVKLLHNRKTSAEKLMRQFIITVKMEEPQ